MQVSAQAVSKPPHPAGQEQEERILLSGLTFVNSTKSYCGLTVRWGTEPAVLMQR